MGGVAPETVSCENEVKQSTLKTNHCTCWKILQDIKIYKHYNNFQHVQWLVFNVDCFTSFSQLTVSGSKVHNIKMTQSVLIGCTWAWGGALMIDSSFD